MLREMHCATEYINIHLYINKKKKIKEEKDLLNASSSGSKDRRLSEVTHYTAVCRRTPFRTSIVEYHRLYFFPKKERKTTQKRWSGAFTRDDPLSLFVDRGCCMPKMKSIRREIANGEKKLIKIDLR